jgi:hypothetical protein
MCCGLGWHKLLHILKHPDQLNMKFGDEWHIPGSHKAHFPCIWGVSGRMQKSGNLNT